MIDHTIRAATANFYAFETGLKLVSIFSIYNNDDSNKNKTKNKTEVLLTARCIKRKMNI